MGKINWGRVVLGGLLAGIVMGVFNAVQIPMFAEAWNTALEALGVGGESPMQNWTTATFLVAGTAIQFGEGIFGVWLYAAIRPRYGPGPMTATIAGFAVWLILSVGLISLVMLTNLTVGSVVALHGPYVVMWIVATNAGAWVYKEDAEEAQAPPAASEVDPA